MATTLICGIISFPLEGEKDDTYNRQSNGADNMRKDQLAANKKYDSQYTCRYQQNGSDCFSYHF